MQELLDESLMRTQEAKRSLMRTKQQEKEDQEARRKKPKQIEGKQEFAILPKSWWVYPLFFGCYKSEKKQNFRF